MSPSLPSDAHEETAKKIIIVPEYDIMKRSTEFFNECAQFGLWIGAKNGIPLRSVPCVM